jgi:hypothetical protein
MVRSIKVKDLQRSAYRRMRPSWLEVLNDPMKIGVAGSMFFSRPDTGIYLKEITYLKLDAFYITLLPLYRMFVYAQLRISNFMSSSSIYKNIY